MAQSFPFDIRKAYTGGPFNPFAQQNVPGTPAGDENDPARYVLPPGEAFFRPWLAIPGGRAFVWPLGIEGFRTVIDPVLGIHRFIGADNVAVDVIHVGEERINLSGTFPGSSGPDAVAALRAIVYADSPDSGKILYVPSMFEYTQRVQVGTASFDKPEDTDDLTYSIEFVRLGPQSRVADPVLQQSIAQPRPQSKGVSASTFTVNGKYNTLRKIAALKLKDANKWQRLYNLNEKMLVKLGVPAHKAPNYVLKLGTKVRL